ncbi:MAG TPA: bifunctional DNA-binding transcriptional regulator/O6-methylguanine-DNA methyltransferase Ada [Candidatus Acidoferrales bacterium]|nr:bifunctional DNA-binding transcriptional regulator/O6-methylguanine-DNA methyltransferase Ada [Candidatus Acidoferrales bacterium]
MRIMSTLSNAAMTTKAALIRKKYLAAVHSHDTQMDGAFVYAVRSTGIYCRPSCPSRRPRENQILFFNRPVDAEQAGFRACRRCHPREIRGDSKAKLVRKVCQEIENHPDDSPSLKTLAKLTGLSCAHLQRTFREAMGITPRQYAEALRVKRFKSELRKGSDVTTALHEVSYGSTSRLYEKSDAQLGMTPATYRKGGLGMNISYTIAESSLGRVLVAGTERGISAVYLGDKDSDLAATLREEYPQAEIQTTPENKSKWVRAIVAHLDESSSPIDLPTDVKGTAFQRRVWQALREIPLGATRTYSDVARAIGQPTAIRAVGHACATNPASIVVPCHRVIRTDGSLGGYRWGLHRKQNLLEKERRAAKLK